MNRLIILAAVLAYASAAPSVAISGLATPLAAGIVSPLAAAPLSAALPATLLPRVQVGPAETTIVRQPVVVQEPEPILRSVPVPIRAVSYAAAPAVVSAPLAAPLAAPWASTIGLPATRIATIGTIGTIGSPLAAPLATPLATPLAAGWGSPLLLK